MPQLLVLSSSENLFSTEFSLTTSRLNQVVPRRYIPSAILGTFVLILIFKIHSGQRGRPKLALTTIDAVRRAQKRNIAFEDERVDEIDRQEELNEMWDDVLSIP